MHNRRLAAGLALVGLLGIAAGEPQARAAEARAAETAASPLAGTWVLTAADTLKPDGVRIHGYGADPQGRLMIDRDGAYVLEIFRAESTRFASGDKARGTADEYRAAVMRMSAHIGHVRVDEAAHTLTFEITQSLFPNWEGARQVRQFQLAGDRLSYQVPASATGDGTIAISEWRRVAP